MFNIRNPSQYIQKRVLVSLTMDSSASIFVFSLDMPKNQANSVRVTLRLSIVVKAELRYTLCASSGKKMQ